MTTCILTLVKNEQDYLDEWIKYHLDLGIDHIFIFEDTDSKSHKDITDKYEQVTLKGVLGVFEDEDEKNKAIRYKETREVNPQHIYLKTCLRYIKKTYDYDWCFVIDVDEFITLENPSDLLKDVISLYDDFDAFLLQWKCYGANGLVKKPDYNKTSVIDTFTKLAEGQIEDKDDARIKTCYNLQKYKDEYFFNQHKPSLSAHFCKTDFNSYLYRPCYDKIYIRHYITKSWEEYVWKRFSRGYMYGGARHISFFFDINPDMRDKKDELLKELRHEIFNRKRNSSSTTVQRIWLPRK